MHFAIVWLGVDEPVCNATAFAHVPYAGFTVYGLWCTFDHGLPFALVVFCVCTFGVG